MVAPGTQKREEIPFIASGNPEWRLNEHGEDFSQTI
jgi:hypothetical protein